jgi:O-antigen ligase
VSATSLRAGARSFERAGGRSATVAASPAFADEALRIVRDPLRILLFVLTVLTVSRLHQHYPLLMKMRPALLLVIAATGYAYLNPRFLTRANVLEFWPMRLLVLLGVLACCSAVFGISLGSTASFILSDYVKTLVYAFLLAVSIRNVRDLFTLVWAYVIGCGILAFFSLFIFGITRSSGSDFARLSNLYTYDSNDLGVMMMMGLSLTLLLLAVSRGAKRGLLLLNLVAIAATVARSGSRGGFLGFVAVGVAALVLANGMSVPRRMLLLIAAPIALALGAPAGYWKQMGTVLQPKDDYNYSAVDGRKAVAQRGLGYMRQYPIFGVGMNNFARAECTISPKLQTLNRTGPIRCTAPHNSYIQAGAELGVPGLIAWVSLLIGVIVTLLGLRRRLPRTWRRGTDAERFIYGATTYFPLAMIGFAVTSFFVSFAWMEPLYTMAAFTTGLYIGLREYTRQQSEMRPRTMTSIPSAPLGGFGWRVARSAFRFRVARALAPQTDSTPCAAL